MRRISRCTVRIPNDISHKATKVTRLKEAYDEKKISIFMFAQKLLATLMAKAPPNGYLKNW